MRKIIQICAIPCAENNSKQNDLELFALCNDGTVWSMMYDSSNWRRLHDIPQDGYKGGDLCDFCGNFITSEIYFRHNDKKIFCSRYCYESRNDNHD